MAARKSSKGTPPDRKGTRTVQYPESHFHDPEVCFTNLRCKAALKPIKLTIQFSCYSWNLYMGKVVGFTLRHAQSDKSRPSGNADKKAKALRTPRLWEVEDRCQFQKDQLIYIIQVWRKEMTHPRSERKFMLPRAGEVEIISL